MTQLILTEEQTRILADAREPVAVLDNRGRLLTYMPPLWTKEEIAEAKRVAATPGPRFTGEQVQRRLQALEKEWERTGGFDEAYMHRFLEELDKADPGEWWPRGLAQ